MVKRKIVTVLLIILASLGTYWMFSGSSVEKVFVMPMRDVVDHEIRFRLKPYMVADKVIVLMEISSYQHAEFIAPNPVKIFVLEDDLGQVYEPTKWEGDTVSEYIKRGQLVFEGVNSDWLQLTLTFFEDENIIFEWVKSEGAVQDSVPTLILDD